MNNTTEVLLQLFNGATWDGNLISKMQRDILVKNGLAHRCDGGWNIISKKGITYLYELGFIIP